MKAPEKIYVEIRHPFGNEFTEILGFEHRGDSDDIEYIRKDVFIEKAYSWLKIHYSDYMHNPTGKMLEAFFGGDMCNDFEDYMKGE